MLGINYFKAEPTEYVRMTRNGKVKRDGKGISAFVMPSRTSIEMVSVAIANEPFAFVEITNDNQEITIQGSITYQVIEPAKALAKYNYSIDPDTKQYLSEDSVKLDEHLLQFVQTNARKVVESKHLEELLSSNDEIARTVAEDLKTSHIIADIGVAVSQVYIKSARPKPEISKALEANYRESLLQKADGAIYERRANAVDQEKQIQENELRNKIDIEEKRQELVELEGGNSLKEADYRSQALKKEFSAYDGMEPGVLTAHALYQLGKNAGRIENLTITPDLFARFLK